MVFFATIVFLVAQQRKNGKILHHLHNLLFKTGMNAIEKENFFMQGKCLFLQQGIRCTKAVGFPIKFRVGSVEDCDKLEKI
jgi:hypothetical protein